MPRCQRICERERLRHVLDLLELEVTRLEQHVDLAMMDNVSKLVTDISAKISSADDQGGYQLGYGLSSDDFLFSPYPFNPKR